MLSIPHTSKKITAIIVTGGSSGIGHEFITQLQKLDGEIRFCNLSRSKPENFSQVPGFFHLPCDLSRADEVASIVQQVDAWLETVEDGLILLINNSGFGSYGPFQDCDGGGQVAMVDVNTRAPVALTAGLLPQLLKRGGWIVNIASTAAFQPTPTMSTYGATKAFLLHWSLGLSEDLKGTGVGVTCVCPGPTTTNFFSAASFKGDGLPGQMTVASVVRKSLKAIEAGRPLVVTGLQNRLLVSLSGFLPKTLIARLSGIVLRQVRK